MQIMRNFLVFTEGKVVSPMLHIIEKISGVNRAEERQRAIEDGRNELEMIKKKQELLEWEME